MEAPFLEKDGAMPSKYPDEVRQRAVRMVLDHEHEYPSQWAAICSVAEKLGAKSETVRLWVRRAEADEGRRPGPTSDEEAELRAHLEQCSACNTQAMNANRLDQHLGRAMRAVEVPVGMKGRLRRANDILKAAASFFGAELDRQSKK